MKYLYLVISTNENGKKHAFAHKIHIDVNLIGIHEIPHAEIIQAFPTMKQAKETAERWNAVYKANGCYLFDDPKF
jgi:hypothetical protein